MRETSFVHALSFDVEDWFHMIEIEAVDDPKDWPRLSTESSLVERYTDLILKICDEYRVKATFFVLGWIAERHPALIRRIAEAGHEIGSHSFWHRKVYEMSPEVFRNDLELSLSAIRSAAAGSTGHASDLVIQGFRAPSFSIKPGNEWVFDELLEQGLTYDASLFPGKRAHGGYSGNRGPHKIETPAQRTIAELPMSLTPVGWGPLKKMTCYSGGGYLRLLPSFLIERGVKAEQSENRPTVVYLHPRDFAKDCPRVPMPILRQFKSYVGIGSTERKLKSLLQRHRWTTCREVLQNAEFLAKN